MVDTELSSLEKIVINRLKVYREEKNLSQLELSLISGVSQNMITYIETGKRMPTLRTLIKLCDALKISPAKLFEEEDFEREKVREMLIQTIQKYI